jgi:hypothetical protein
MKYLIFIFVSSIPFHLLGQSVNETVETINNLLKMYSNHSAKHIFPDFLYSQIEVDSNGLIASYIYEKNPKENKIVKIPNCHGYLKSLDGIIVSYQDTGIYKLNLVCPKGNKCLFNGHGNIIPSDPIGMGFAVTNLETQSKIENALMHLLVLAKNNAAFYSIQSQSN